MHRSRARKLRKDVRSAAHWTSIYARRLRNAVDYQRCDYARAVGKAELDNRAAYPTETGGVRDAVAVLQSEYPTADLSQRTAMAVIRDEAGKRGVNVVCAH